MNTKPIEKMWDYNKDLNDIFNRISDYQNPAFFHPNDWALINPVCLNIKKNIELFNCGVKPPSGTNIFYVEFMKMAIRRQIELAQRISIPIIQEKYGSEYEGLPPLTEISKKEWDDMQNLWSISVESFAEIKKIKNIASDYTHDSHIPTKDIASENMTPEIIYITFGGGKNTLESVIEKAGLHANKEIIFAEVSKLFGHDITNFIGATIQCCNLIEKYKERKKN
jgi:hypothetical protein